MKRRRSDRPGVRASRILTLLAMLAGALLLPAHTALAAGTTYYVNCSAATNGSGTQASPWNSVSSVNGTTFAAGDSILFAAGTTCTGQLTPGGLGASGSPITMGAYGTGAKPAIDANGATGPVIHLLNQQYWEIGGLELTNAASSPAYRSGVLAENSAGGVLHHIRVHDMNIHHISGWAGGWYSTNAGVGVQTDHATPVSTWDDVVVENNTFDHVDRIAVAVTPDGDGQGTGLTTGTVIRNNTMTYDGADDILVVKNDGALIDGNKAGYGGAKNTCPPSGQYCNGASAGIWMSGSSNTVVQNNEVYCHVNGADGTGYDVDWGNHNTTFQYNYSHQNLGGFMLVMPPFTIANEPTSTVPSDGTVIRYNISENDGTNSGCPAAGTPTHGTGVFHFVGNIPNQSGSSVAVPLIYNNSVYVNKSGLNTPILYSRRGSSVTGTLSFRNNAVFNYGTGGYFTTSSGSIYSNNLFYGAHPSSEPADSAKVVTDPEVRNPGNANTSSSFTGINAYQVHPSSPVIRAGTVISNNGGKDAFGNAVSATAAPNIGAYNGTGGNLVSNAGFESGSMSPWVNSGAAPSVTSSDARTGGYALTTQASGSGANQTLTGLSPNTTYLLTGWAKVANAGETLAIGVKNYGGTETFTNVATTSYSQSAVLFTTGSSNTVATVYCWKNTGGSGAGYCDDLAVEAVSSATNAVTNPGFEAGALTPWVQSTGTASSAVASNARSDTYSLQTGVSASGAIQTVSGLTSSGTYLLAAWAKVATAGEEVAIGVKSFGGTETYLRTSTTSYAQQPIGKGGRVGAFDPPTGRPTADTRAVRRCRVQEERPKGICPRWAPGRCPCVFGQVGRVVVQGVWNDVLVHADDQVGEGVPAELAVFLRGAVDGRPAKIAPSVCEGCGGRVFFVLVNASGAERECSGCGSRAFIADSEEYWNEESWEDDEPGAAGCPCGSEEFEAAVAFSLGDDGSVRWVTVGLRCIKDGFSGVYADWKIDYGPTDHLLTMV